MDLYRSLYEQNICLHHKTTSYSTDSFAIHTHDNYQIHYFLYGDVEFFLNNSYFTIKPHTLILIPPHTPHGSKINSHSTYERYLLEFSENAIPAEHKPLLLAPFDISKETLNGFFLNSDHFNIRRFLEDILECDNLDYKIRNSIVKIRLQNLLSQIVIMSKQVKGLPTDVESKTIKDIISYINENLSSNLTLDLICDKFFITKQTLNSQFKKATGTTVIDYIIKKRIDLAYELIVQGHSATQISEHVGFKDYSSFFRAYKKIKGISPSKAKEENV